MQRPINVYGHKRRRAQAAVNVAQPAGSPPSDPDKQEISLSEMTRRMKKRSHRLSLSAPDPHDHDHSSKRSRYRNSDKCDDPTAMVLEDGVSLPLTSQNQNTYPFQTPRPSVAPSERSMRPTSVVLSRKQSQDQLSPVPLTRTTILPRLSLRNLKETETVPGVSSRPDLASPFNSRPNSRASSPSKSRSKIKRSRPKSRTLSANLAENQTNGPIIDMNLQTASAAPSRKKLKTRHHSRNPSVPSVTGQTSPRDWLIQAQAPSRATSFRFDLSMLVDLSHQSQQGPFVSPSSFISDNPLAFSTPVLKRSLPPRAGKKLYNKKGPRFSVAQLELPTQSFAEKCHTLPVDQDAPMVDLNTTPESAPPRHRQHKRRQDRLSEVLFSNTFDSLFTATTSTSGPTASVPAVNDTLLTASTLDTLASTRTMSLTGIFDRAAFDRCSALAPAFSPLSRVPTDMSTAPPGITDNEDVPIPDAGIADHDSLMSSSPDPLDMFRIKDDSDIIAGLRHMSINTEDTYDKWPIFDRSHSLPTNKDKDDPKTGHVNRRRRDTIRASDLGQGREVGVAAVPAKHAKGGRTRSGTVTQSSYQASMQTRIGKDGKMTRLDNGLPLSPQRDDESDDPLLMVSRKVGERYDWE